MLEYKASCLTCTGFSATSLKAWRATRFGGLGSWGAWRATRFGVLGSSGAWRVILEGGGGGGGAWRANLVKIQKIWLSIKQVEFSIRYLDKVIAISEFNIPGIEGTPGGICGIGGICGDRLPW